MHCSRAYVHKNIQPFIRYVKIPAESAYRAQSKTVDEDNTKDFIREAFLMQERIAYFSENSASVWFNNSDFVAWFNRNFSAYHRTQPADIKKLFPSHVTEAKELLGKAIKYLDDLEHCLVDLKECVKELNDLSKKCGTHALFIQTLIVNNKAVITDKTTKVPFVPINRPIKNVSEMDFKIVNDFDYPSQATRYFESTGAICYRKLGKALYKESLLTAEEHLLLSPSKLWSK